MFAVMRHVSRSRVAPKAPWVVGVGGNGLRAFAFLCSVFVLGSLAACSSRVETVANTSGVSPSSPGATQAELRRSLGPRGNDASGSDGTSSSGSRGACPEGMVYIPPGTFEMGRENRYDAAPLHRVTFEKGFCIDRTEVTVAAYGKCVQAGACTRERKAVYCNHSSPDDTYGEEPPLDHPQNCVDWHQARAFCVWAGKRLVTDAEWEYAARGSDGREFPWGNEPPDNARMHWSGGGGPRVFGTAPVGSHPGDVSPFGVLDMAGNVSEWVEIDPKQATQGDEAVGDDRRSVRGSSWTNGLEAAPAWRRLLMSYFTGQQAQSSSRGFRCAQSAQ